MRRHDQVVVPLDCGSCAIITIQVDPAGCMDVGHLCLTPEELAALFRGAMRDLDEQARRRD